MLKQVLPIITTVHEIVRITDLNEEVTACLLHLICITM